MALKNSMFLEGRMGEGKSRFKDCLEQSKILLYTILIPLRVGINIVQKRAECIIRILHASF